MGIVDEGPSSLGRVRRENGEALQLAYSMFELFPMLLPVGVRSGHVPDVACHAADVLLDVVLKVGNKLINRHLHLSRILPETYPGLFSCLLFHFFVQAPVPEGAMRSENTKEIYITINYLDVSEKREMLDVVGKANTFQTRPDRWTSFAGREQDWEGPRCEVTLLVPMNRPVSARELHVLETFGVFLAVVTIPCELTELPKESALFGLATAAVTGDGRLRRWA